MKKLPIGISTLEKIRSENYVYIDKSHHVANLFNSGGRYYFLSRPRRFGKSLFNKKVNNKIYLLLNFITRVFD